MSVNKTPINIAGAFAAALSISACAAPQPQPVPQYMIQNQQPVILSQQFEPQKQRNVNKAQPRSATTLQAMPDKILNGALRTTEGAIQQGINTGIRDLVRSF